jgi:carbon starvation protein
MYVCVFLGPYLPFKMPAIGGIPPTGVWTIILLIYAFCASVLPVTTLLQPRDFINSHQLLIAMVLLVLGVLFAGLGGDLRLVAPAVQTMPAEAPPMWPFLFITIACGAISGFHALVSSGTSAKQVRSEDDALFVGYGSMLMEGALATLVIIAVAAGIGMGYTTKDGTTLTGVAAWTTHYASWASAAGLGSKISAFVDGAAGNGDKQERPHGRRFGRGGLHGRRHQLKVAPQTGEQHSQHEQCHGDQQLVGIDEVTGLKQRGDRQHRSAKCIDQ